MKKEQIEKEDGRYLIFYSFDDESTCDSAEEDDVSINEDDNALEN